jgi:uncharacterized membrane protein
MPARNSDADILPRTLDLEGLGDCAPFDPAAIFPRNSTERINLMIHFHRAEIARMAGWRDRIDRTTNWAITVVAASLSYAFSSASVSHVTLIACMVMVACLLFIEARRFGSSTYSAAGCAVLIAITMLGRCRSIRTPTTGGSRDLEVTFAIRHSR